MNSYITGSTIKALREAKGLTQAELADKIGVTSKAVSRWETAKGLPDITLIQPLAAALHTSVIELMNGEQIINKNRSANMLRTRFYVCPVCGNIIHSTGDTMISCCGITLSALEADSFDEQHEITTEQIDGELYISVNHDMSKVHYISFLALISSDRVQLVKLYPEGNAEARFKPCGSGFLFAYCNKHGLMKQKI